MKLLVEKIVNKLRKKKLTISVAESFTGGLLSSSLTLIPNASKIYTLGFDIHISFYLVIQLQLLLILELPQHMMLLTMMGILLVGQSPLELISLQIILFQKRLSLKIQFINSLIM